MSLVARHLEENGIPTVIIGGARDITEHCGVPRFVFTDCPLGSPCGEPFNADMQRNIVGMALDLEYALRGVAKATQKARFAVAMATRASAARKKIEAIAAAVSAPELKAMLAAANSTGLKLNNEAALSKAADGVQKAARAFSAKYDGSKLAAVDGMIPTKFIGKATP